MGSRRESFLEKQASRELRGISGLTPKAQSGGTKRICQMWKKRNKGDGKDGVESGKQSPRGQSCTGAVWGAGAMSLTEIPCPQPLISHCNEQGTGPPPLAGFCYLSICGHHAGVHRECLLQG